MTDLFDYIEWRGDLPLTAVPLCDVDALLFARLSYMPFEGVVPTGFDHEKPLPDAARQLLAKAQSSFVNFRTLEDKRLLEKLLDAPRYQGLALCGYETEYDKENEEQFAALTIRLPLGLCVAFRGTDGTLVGWKEDFNMSFADAVPAQRHAVEYLNRAAALPGVLRLCGHSKGGNLAVYAAAFCEPDVQERIAAVRSFDGPGFQQAVTEREAFHRVIDRVRTYVPRASVIGLLLEHEEDYTVVESRGTGIAQHNVYLWEIRRGGFHELENVSGGSQLIDQTLREWLAGMTLEQRERVFNGLFAALQASEAETFREVRDHGKMAALKAILAQDDDTKKETMSSLRILYQSLKKALPEDPLKELEDRLTTLIRVGKKPDSSELENQDKK